MRLLGAFLRLVRWPNLLIIALTQVLFYFCFVSNTGSAGAYQHVLTPRLLVLLVSASVCIAAGGYIINDYFDLNIDKINKPVRLVVERVIRRRWAMIWHLVLSAAGVLLSFYLSLRIDNWMPGWLNLFSVLLLWFYSTTFKKNLLIGNVIISVLTGWVILVMYFCEWRIDLVLARDARAYQYYLRQLFKLAILYSAFAFIISLIREVVKDIEDISGDEKFGRRTMPIVWGIPATKIFAATWLGVLVAALLIIQFYLFQLHWWWATIYSFLFVLMPLVYVLYHLYVASAQHDYHRLSNWLKLIMLTGILSMPVFRYYEASYGFGF